MNRHFSHGLYILGLMALAWLLFGQSLDYPWVFDDHTYIVLNPYLGDWSNFTKLLTNFKEMATGASRFGVDGDVSTNFVLRPITYFTFQLNHHFGGLNPGGYRIFNIGVHCCNSVLVALLVKSLLETPRCSVLPRGVEIAAAIAGAFFLVHPLQIESVTYVIQRATSLCTLFYLLCLFFHLSQRRRSEGLPWRAWIASGSALAAMLTKESGVTAPFVALFLSQLAFGGGIGNELWRARGLFLWLPVVPALLFAVSYCQRGAFDFLAAWSVASANKDHSYVWGYAATQPEVLWRYWRSFVWPTEMCVDPALQPVAGLGSLRFWLPIGAWIVAFASLGWTISKTSYRRCAGIVAVALGWFFMVIAPDSSIVPLPDVMADHRTYLPLVGVCGMVGVLFGWFLTFASPWRLGVFVGLVFMALCGSTFLSQQKWGNACTLWADACQRNPLNVRAWVNLGSAALDADEVERAISAFERAVKIRPTAVAYGNLAVAEIKAGRFEKALEFGLEGLKCPSTGYDYFILGALGEAYARLQRWSEAVAPLEASYQRRQAYAPVVWMLANAYFITGQIDRARVVLEQGLRDHPGTGPFLELLREVDAARDRIQQQARMDPVEAPASEFRLRLGYQ